MFIPQRLELGNKRFKVIDDLIGTKLLHPFHRFRTGSRADHRKSGMLGELRRDRTNSSGGANDQERFSGIPFSINIEVLAEDSRNRVLFCVLSIPQNSYL